MKRITGFILLGLFLFPGCKKEKKEAPKLDSFPVRVEKLSRTDLEDLLVVVGSIKAKDEAVLYSRVPGKLLENLKKEGDRVKKGEAVALVERDEVGVQFKPAPVPSTLNGVVGKIYPDRGSQVTLNSPIALVVDDSELLAQGQVPESSAGKVQPGQEVYVTVESFPDEKVRGKITKVSPVLDPNTRTSAIETTLEDSPHLKSGMFAEMAVVLRRKEKVLAVPLRAVLEENGKSIVFAAENNKASKRAVRLEMRSKTHVEILEGVREGEAVITFGLFGLKDGSAIEIIEGEEVKR